jgi:hypothetical protein
MRQTFRPALLALGAALSFTAGANADTLPAPSLTGYFCAGIFQYCNTPLAVSFPQNSGASYSDPANGTASASGTGVTAPTPDLFATASASGYASGFASLTLLYDIQLIGPGGQVPVTINTLGYASSNSQAGVVIENPKTFAVSYQASINQGGSTYVYDNGSFVLGPGPYGIFGRTDTVMLTEGVIYQVGMNVTVTATADHPSESAGADPYFTDIPAGYELLISQGVGNAPFSSATPLPAALPLFVSGLGAMGVLGWRKKRKARVA